ncbi:transcriptional regulator FatR [Paenibacillus elgii]|uniref:TetR/AcrR family transcriptional regulator n=1 Tax=Paenibacillus elgii TaxID=189691 RepID=UPI002D7C8FA4|nr:transcriptional regulator FatR [Paenibacillus elgii]
MFDKYHRVQKAVLETTLSLIIEKELQATSMSLIAKEAGVSTGNIYHYFDSKESIINELYKAIVQFNGEKVLDGFYSDEPIRVRIERAWENLIRLSLEYPQGFRFIEQYSFSPYIYDDIKKEAYDGGWCGPLEKLYAQAIQEKLFIDMDPSLMAQMHYGSFVYVIKGYLHGKFTISDEEIKRIIEATWNSVSAR